MQLPSRFTLGPHVITVRIVTAEEMAEHHESALGLWIPTLLTILIVEPSDTLKPEVQIHTFWHEFSHAMFWCLGRMDECADEILVDQCGMFLTQAMTSFDVQPATVDNCKKKTRLPRKTASRKA